MSKRVVRVARLVLWREGRLVVQEDLRLALPEQYLRLPGGRIEPDELPAHSAAREFREETGLEAVVGRPCYVGEAHFRRRGQLIHEVAVYFMAVLDPRIELPPQPPPGEHVRTLELAPAEILLRARLPERLFAAVLEDGPAGPATLRYVIDGEP